MHKPAIETIPEWYRNYVNLVPNVPLTMAFEDHQKALVELLQGLPEEKWNYRYAENKWTIKEMVQHIIDTDRIFNYRALAFARNEKAALPGFDENKYAAASKAANRKPQQLIDELKSVQLSSALLFQSFDEEQLQRPGTASGHRFSVAIIGYVLVGHTMHHINILKERYL